MAENPIRKEDIIDGEAIRSEIQKVLGDLLKLAAVMQKDVAVAAAEAKAGLEGVDITTKEGRQHIKEASKEITDLSKSYTTLNKAITQLKKESDSLNTAVDKSGKSYDSLNARLKELTRQFKATGDEGLRGSLLPQINKTRGEIDKFDKMLGNHQRNVGNYGKSILDAGKQLLSFGGIVGVATIVLNKIKEAVMSTTGAINTMNIISEVSKQLFYDLSITGRINVQNLWNAIEATKILNALRTEEYRDQYLISGLDKELQELRIKAADQMLSDKVRLEALNGVKEKEAQITKIRVDHLKEELIATMKLIEKRPADEKLLQKSYAIMTQINNALAEEDRSMKRVETTRTGFIKKAHDDAIKRWYDEIDTDQKIKEEREKAEQAMAIKSAQITQDVQDIIDKTDEEWFKMQDEKKKKWIEDGREQYESDKKQAEFQIEDYRKQLNAREELDKAYENAKLNIAKSSANLLSAIAGKNKTIQKASLIADRAIAIAEIIIQTRKANAANTAWGALAGPGGVAWASIMNTKNNIASAINIAAVVAATIEGLAGFIEGGYTGNGLFKDKTGKRVAGYVHEKEYVMPKAQTEKYRGLLEAINEDNPMAIAEEIRNRQFHTVWGGVQAQLSQVNRQDPYTQKMYELMKNDIKIYQDSNGDTNIVYPNGTRRVIRKYTA